MSKALKHTVVAIQGLTCNIEKRPTCVEWFLNFEPYPNQANQANQGLMAHTYPCQDNRLFLLVASASFLMAPVTQLVNWPSSRNKQRIAKSICCGEKMEDWLGPFMLLDWLFLVGAGIPQRLLVMLQCLKWIWWAWSYPIFGSIPDWLSPSDLQPSLKKGWQCKSGCLKPGGADVLLQLPHSSVPSSPGFIDVLVQWSIHCWKFHL